MAMDDDHIDLTEHEESDTTEKEVNKASNTDVQIDVSKRPLFKHYVSIKAKDRKDQTAKCIYCNLIFKTPFGTTKTLSDHLKRKHDEAFKTYNADKERLELEKKKRKEESCGAAHPLITTVLKKKKIQWSSKHPKAQALTKKTAQWLN
ncbi:uncharacterized protein [Bemisia tabaci]|uniref:uncharacterized protein n=1 Tax=Bemisia tabaci TaxID=7038 RepID=UPI003B27FBD6